MSMTHFRLDGVKTAEERVGLSPSIDSVEKTVGQSQWIQQCPHRGTTLVGTSQIHNDNIKLFHAGIRNEDSAHYHKDRSNKIDIPRTRELIPLPVPTPTKPIHEADYWVAWTAKVDLKRYQSQQLQLRNTFRYVNNRYLPRCRPPT
ncbi:hypothetical protein QE435_004727 [Rhizobium sp. SORGH_AS 787]|nr:hypothetical protein [Rhizobium sp. SORGH_AS_0787]